MKYKVEILETLRHVEEVEADSPQDALDIVESMYYDCEIILESNKHIGTDFKVMDENEEEIVF